MSEQLTPNHEASAERVEQNSEAQAERLKQLQEAGKEARHEAAEQLDTIQSTVESEAISGAEMAVGDRQSGNDGSQPLGLHQSLKTDSYKRTLAKVQSHLNPVERRFSKVVHAPVVETVSELGGKTIARPRGILFGGIFACLGSILFLYMTKHYGFEYNYLLFIALFGGGYFVGLLIDLISRSFKRA